MLETGAAAEIQSLVEVFIGLFVTGTVAGTVDQVERFLGIGQRNQQRVITPLAIVGDVHALFALAERRGDGAVGINDRQLEELLWLLLPDREASLIERLHEQQHRDRQGEQPACAVPNWFQIPVSIKTTFISRIRPVCQKSWYRCCTTTV